MKRPIVYVNMEKMKERGVRRKKLEICLILLEFLSSIFVLFVYELLELFLFVHLVGCEWVNVDNDQTEGGEEKEKEFREMKQNMRERERVIFVDVNKDHEQRLKRCVCVRARVSPLCRSCSIARITASTN